MQKQLFSKIIFGALTITAFASMPLRLAAETKPERTLTQICKHYGTHFAIGFTGGVAHKLFPYAMVQIIKASRDDEEITESQNRVDWFLSYPLGSSIIGFKVVPAVENMIEQSRITPFYREREASEACIQILGAIVAHKLVNSFIPRKKNTQI